MKKPIGNKRFLTILAIVLFTSVTSLFAQVTVTGVVKEAASGSTLPGAAVIVQGTNYGTITDNYGKYTLTGVEQGATIVFSYVGYIDQTSVVDASADNNVKIDASLDYETIGVEEVVVTFQLLGQTKAINEQLNADGNVAVVSEEKMKELPDANAAEAIGRISGISLQRNQGEGSKVVMRGLEPKFSNITVNGVKVPSTDPEDRSVDLSMISPEMLQGIEVFKAPTPDMDGDAVGGTINLRINKAPDAPKLKLKAGGGYNDLRSDWKDYYFSGSYSRRFMDNKLGVIIQGNTERVNRSSDDIRTSYKQVFETDSLIPATYPSRGDIRVTEEIRKRSGFSSNIDYQLPKGSVSIYGFYNQTTRDIDRRRNQAVEASELRHYVEHREMKSDVTSVMLNGDYAFGILKVDGNVAYSKTNNNTPNYYEGQWRISGNAFSDPSLVDEYDIKNWFDLGNFNEENVATRRLELNKREIAEENVSAALNFELPFNLGDSWSLSLKFGGKYNQLDRIRNYGGDYNSWYFNGVSHGADFPGVVTGGSGSNLFIYNQTFFMNNYSSEEINGFKFHNAYDVDRVVNWIDTYNSPQNGYYKNFEESADNMDLTENILAGYFMFKLKYKKILTVIPGVRIENSDNVYNSYITEKFDNYDNQTRELVTNKQQYTEVLPHFHLKFEPAQWYKLRFSAAKTLARPNYNYVATSAFVNRAESANEVTQGNPDLKHMTAMNYDLSMSFHSFRYGLFTVGGFYKDIQNIFYPRDGFVLHSDSLTAAYGYPQYQGITLNSYVNSPEARVYGFEIDLQTSLKFLPGAWSGFVFSANFTRLFSETTISGYKLEQGDPVFNPFTGTVEYPDQTNLLQERKTGIPGQVDMIFNLSAGYEFKGFSVRLSGAHQADYIEEPQLQTEGINDEYRLAFWRWDLALKQKITKNVEVYLNFANLTNMVEEKFISQHRFVNVPTSKAYPSTVFTGRTMTYGLRVNF